MLHGQMDSRLRGNDDGAWEMVLEQERPGSPAGVGYRPAFRRRPVWEFRSKQKGMSKSESWI
jgi:hypothetical protein